MIGDERVRFCGQCNLNVYNLSAMTRPQAENLIAGSEDRLCVRFYRRADGSILTQDCPVGLGALRQRMSRIRKAIAAVVFGFSAGASGSVAVHRMNNVAGDSIFSRRPQTMGQIAEPVKPVVHEPTVGTYAFEDPVRPRGRRKRAHRPG